MSELFDDLVTGLNEARLKKGRAKQGHILLSLSLKNAIIKVRSKRSELMQA